MKSLDPNRVREQVQQHYGAIAEQAGSCCGTSGCCDGAAAATPLGYTAGDLAAAPEGSNLGLGCGNPTAIASLRPGEVVLDLGSGAGVDCFLAARAVGGKGRVIGVDMTPAMIAKARDNARRSGYANVEFRLGEIEALPVADASVDLIISNCVINLSPDKPHVFREAFRVLKSGGRLAIADIVATRPLSAASQAHLGSICACVGGAALIERVRAELSEAGFTRVEVVVNEASREFVQQWSPDREASDAVVSAFITALKP
jgi:arsenite methyltransferase